MAMLLGEIVPETAMLPVIIRLFGAVIVPQLIVRASATLSPRVVAPVLEKLVQVMPVSA